MVRTHGYARKVIEVALDELKPYQGNARKHSEKQISHIAVSLSKYGFLNPIVIDEVYTVLAGHGRVQAARLLGYQTVPAILISHLTEAEKKAYVIADNRIAELAGWDKEILAIELQFLVQVSFDVEATGFSTKEIDMILDPEEKRENDTDDVLPEMPAVTPLSRTGYIWILGVHLIICGSATDPAAYRALMGKDRAVMVFADPPYNVKIDGHVCGLGKVKHREFGMASGEMTPEEFIDFLSQYMAQLCRYTVSGSLHFHCMDWRHLIELLTAGRENYSEYKQLIVWNKDNAGMGAFYRSKHELIAVFKNGNGKHINNFGLGENGRYRTNVWDYAGANSVSGKTRQELANHPTPKPVSLVADALRDCSLRGSIVLDPFMGSGTTLIAAERTGRIARGIELDPIYVDLIVQRWQDLTGKSAILQGTDKTFDELRASQSLVAQEVADHE